MTEISKMYENAGVEHGSCKNYNRLEQCCNSPFCDSGMCPNGIGGEKNPFTAEKQLKLIKWLCQKTYRNYLLIRYDFTNYFWQIECNMIDSNKADSFNKAIASIVNNLWQSLTDQEKEEIRGILK